MLISTCSADTSCTAHQTFVNARACELAAIFNVRKALVGPQAVNAANQDPESIVKPAEQVSLLCNPTLCCVYFYSAMPDAVNETVVFAMQAA